MKTTTTALTIIDTRAERIRAARDRHPNTTPAVIALYAHTSSTPKAADILATGDTAAFLTIRARHQSAATPIFRDLANAQSRDRRALMAAEQSAREDEHRAAHDAHRKAAATLQAVADRKTTDPATAAACAKQAKAHRKAAEVEQSRAESLRKAREALTLSDRADLMQAAALAFFQTDNIGEACRAAGREVSRIASPDALTATRTKLHPISAERAAAERAAHPDQVTIDPISGEETATPCKVPFNVRGASTGFYTIEHRTFKRPTESRPNGWYKVDHYHTAAPYISYEEFAAGEAAQSIATNGGINAIMCQADADMLTALFIRANLTERERLIVTKAADQTAARHAAAARAEYWQTRRPAIKALPKSRRRAAIIESKAAADNAARAARWESAFDRCGIYAERTRQRIKSAIRGALTEAAKAAEPMTPAEIAERDRRAWEREQRNGKRGILTPSADRADLIGAVQAATSGRKPHKPVIAWREDYPTPCPIDPQRAAEDARAAQATRAAFLHDHRADRAIMEYRRTITHAEQFSRAAYAAHNAAHAARVFFDNMTPAAQLYAATERERAAILDSLTIAHHDTPSAYPALNAQAAALVFWRAMTEEEQAAAALRIE